MFVNHEEHAIVCKVLCAGASNAKLGDLLHAYSSHFAATDGEHTSFERRRFAPLDELEGELGAVAAAEFASAAADTMGVDYAELSESGELVWMRTRISDGDADQFTVHVDCWAVDGASEPGALHDFVSTSADALLFVANGLDLADSRERWLDLPDHLRESAVLLVTDVTFADEVAEHIKFEGRTFAAGNGFEEALGAYFAACESALTRARGAQLAPQP